MFATSLTPASSLFSKSEVTEGEETTLKCNLQTFYERSEIVPFVSSKDLTSLSVTKGGKLLASYGLSNSTVGSLRQNYLPRKDDQHVHVVFNGGNVDNRMSKETPTEIVIALVSTRCQDAGHYSCTATYNSNKSTHEVSSKTASGTLIVIASKSADMEVIRKPEMAIDQLTGKLNASCSVQGNTNAQAEWSVKICSTTLSKDRATSYEALPKDYVSELIISSNKKTACAFSARVTSYLLNVPLGQTMCGIKCAFKVPWPPHNRQKTLKLEREVPLHIPATFIRYDNEERDDLIALLAGRPRVEAKPEDTRATVREEKSLNGMALDNIAEFWKLNGRSKSKKMDVQNEMTGDSNALLRYERNKVIDNGFRNEGEQAQTKVWKADGDVVQFVSGGDAGSNDKGRWHETVGLGTKGTEREISQSPRGDNWKLLALLAAPEIGVKDLEEREKGHLRSNTWRNKLMKKVDDQSARSFEMLFKKFGSVGGSFEVADFWKHGAEKRVLSAQWLDGMKGKVNMDVGNVIRRHLVSYQRKKQNGVSERPSQKDTIVSQEQDGYKKLTVVGTENNGNIIKSMARKVVKTKTKSKHVGGNDGTSNNVLVGMRASGSNTSGNLSQHLDKVWQDQEAENRGNMAGRVWETLIAGESPNSLDTRRKPRSVDSNPKTKTSRDAWRVVMCTVTPGTNETETEMHQPTVQPGTTSGSPKIAATWEAAYVLVSLVSVVVVIAIAATIVFILKRPLAPRRDS